MANKHFYKSEWYMVQLTANGREDYHNVEGKTLQTVEKDKEANVKLLYLIQNELEALLVLRSPSPPRRRLLLPIRMLPKHLKCFLFHKKNDVEQSREFIILYTYIQAFIPKGFNSLIKIRGHNKRIFYKESKLLNTFEQKENQTLAFLPKNS